MKRSFNIAEILESVDVIVSDNIFKAYDKNKIINGYKKFNNKNIDMSDNKETEKIIVDAEESLKDKALENKNKIDQNPLILNTVASPNLDLLEPLILEKEFLENEKNLEDLNLGENIIDEENNEKELENNYIYQNDLLKSENIKQQEVIKDLNILLYDFKKQKRYSDLYNKIKLYQEDNTILRKKIFNLSEIETRLRLQLSEVTVDKNIDTSKNKTFEESSKVEKEEIRKLNIQIQNLSQKNNQMKSELLSLKEYKENQSTDVKQKINFYREEYAKIIVAKSDIEKKLENTKIQLATNENNKRELRAALSNLNRILDSSNVESSTFVNKTEKQETATNPIDIDKIKEE